MATAVSQHVPILATMLDFSKRIVFRKTATNLTGISRKHVI